MKQSIMIIFVFISFFIVLNFSEKENTDLFAEEFKLNTEKKDIIIQNLNEVEHRLETGPYYSKELEPKGLSIINAVEQRTNNKKEVIVTVQSDEIDILYEQINVSVSLYDKNKELVTVLKEVINNVQPKSIYDVSFDISSYKASSYKVHVEGVNPSLFK